MSSLLDKGVDPTRWHDVHIVPCAPIHAWVARLLMNRIIRRHLITVEWPDGELSGSEERDRPRLVLHRPRDFLHRLGRDGLIGFGQSYQAGDWDSPDLPALLTELATGVDTLVPVALQRLRRRYVAASPGATANSLTGARRNISHHYDLSNELFGQFLDETMTYSSALFAQGRRPRWEDLAEAQRRKIDRLLDQTGVGPGSRVLEIGTGWGELAVRAGARGATVDTITLSREQLDVARERIQTAGLTESVRAELRDYRELDTDPNPPDERRYDAIVSVEMVEAIGRHQWPRYFQTLDRLLRPNGRVGIQAITMRHDRMVAAQDTYTWIHKYIFPGGLIPSVTAIERTIDQHTDLSIRDRLDFGADYAQTLRLWRERFDAVSSISDLDFDEVFRRTWRLYLAYSEAGFASGHLDVHQFTLRRKP